MLEYTTYRHQSGYPCPSISRTVPLDEALAMLFSVSLEWGGYEAASAENTFAITSRCLNCEDRCEYTGEGSELLRTVCRTFTAIRRRNHRLAQNLSLDATFCAATIHQPSKLIFTACLGKHAHPDDLEKAYWAIEIVREHDLKIEHVTAAFMLALEGFDFVEALEIAVMRPRYRYHDLLPA